MRAWRASRSAGGACTTICFSVFIAVVRAFTAVSRVIFSWRIISTAPSAVFGMAVDCPASTDRAATSASRVSDLPAARRVRRSPRFTWGLYGWLDANASPIYPVRDRWGEEAAGASPAADDH